MPHTARLHQTLKRVRALVVLNRILHRGIRRARALKRRVSDPLLIREYLGAHPVRKLQVGSGPNLLNDWLNTDLVPDVHLAGSRQIVFLDAAKPFPFDDMTRCETWTLTCWRTSATQRRMQRHSTPQK